MKKAAKNVRYAALTLLAAIMLPVLSAHAQATKDNNMGMGNPSNATTSATDSNNYLIVKPQFTLSYNNSKGMANWISWHLSTAWKGTATRCDCFTQDATLPTGYFKATTTDYTSTGFDRGHLCPSDDRDGSDTDNAATFKMTNIAPQAPILNQQTWGNLEDYCRTLITQGNELYIIAGGYGQGGNGSGGGTTNTIAAGEINVPSHFWKVILVLPVGTNDTTRVTSSTRIIAVDMPNIQTVNSHTWDYYRVSVDTLEARTGFNFLSSVHDSVEGIVEATIDNGTSGIAQWDFTGLNNVATSAATNISDKLDTSTASNLNVLTRGATAASSAGANSFRTTGFKKDGISAANTDYYEVKVKAKTGYTLSIAGFETRFDGTSSYYASPGVSSQFAYSLDGTTFTLIGSAVQSTSLTPPVFDCSGVSALQNLSSSTTVYIRYYASGQTTTGGWGLGSSYSGALGFVINGSLSGCSGLPAAGSISGNTALIAGDVSTLSDSVAGGIWSSINTSVATIGSSGMVSAVSVGTSTISYTVSTVCGTNAATTIVTVSIPTPTSLTNNTWDGMTASSATGASTFATLPAGTTPGSANISVSQWNRNVVVNASGTGFYNSSGWSTGSTLAAAQADGKYIYFTVTNGSSAEMKLTAINIIGQRSSTGPASMQVQYSTGGGGDQSFGSSTTPPTSSGTITFTGSLCIAPGATYTFKIYGWGATSSGGTFRVTNGSNISATYVTGRAVLTSSASTNSSPVCAGTNFSLYGGWASDGVPPYSYSWVGPVSYTGTSKNATVTSPATSATGTYSYTVTDNLGCTISNSTLATVNSCGRPGALDEQAAATSVLSVTCSPNPFKDELFVSFVNGKQSLTTINVFNISGLEIFNTVVNNTHGEIYVPFSSFAPGTYYVVVASGIERVQQRVIKQ